MHNVLWIEDDALFDLTHLTAPVYATFRYRLETAKNATDGLNRLLTSGVEYHVVVVDVRLPPGNDPDWVELYHKDAKNLGADRRLNSKLGIQLLYSLLDHQNKRITLPDIPEWVASERFAVFTVEERRGMTPYLEELGIAVYARKWASLPPNALLDLIEQVIAQQTQGNH